MSETARIEPGPLGWHTSALTTELQVLLCSVLNSDVIMFFDMINLSEALENEIVAKSKSNSNIWIYLETFWQTVDSVLTSILFNTDNNHMSY